MVVGSEDTNGATDLPVVGLLLGIVSDIEVEVVGALGGARLGEFAGVVDLDGMDMVGRMGLDESGRLN